MIRFTAAELAELAAADAAAEAEPLTPDEWKEAVERDQELRRKTDRVAERQRAYRKANKEKVAEYQRAYRKANKEKVAERRHQYYLRTGR